jgi:ATP-dependent protease ClpP protease subunit
MAIIALCFVSGRASASVSMEYCTLKRAMGQNPAGSKIRIEVPHAAGQPDLLTWYDENCQPHTTVDPIVNFTINGTIDSRMEGAIRNIYDSFKRTQRLISMKRFHMTVLFSVDSEGGDVERAIRIGRMLRELNANIWVNSSCLSACVFILAGGVERYVSVFGAVGIHRPYFSSLDRRSSPQDVVREMARIDGLITNFLREMNLPIGLLDTMKGVGPSEIRVLSGGALQSSGLDAPDPVFDELRTAHDAWRYGTNSAEVRRRRAVSKRCDHQSASNSYVCGQAGMYGLSESEYRRRDDRMRSICAAAIEAIRRRGTSWPPDNERENVLKCQRDVMLGLR